MEDRRAELAISSVIRHSITLQLEFARRLLIAEAKARNAMKHRSDAQVVDALDEIHQLASLLAGVSINR